MTYLASAPVIATRSLEEARDAVTSTILRHSLTAPTDRIDMRLNSVMGRRMTVSYISYGSEIDGTVPPTEDSHVVSLIVAGECLASSSDGGRVRSASNEGGFVYSPVQTHRGLLSPDAEQLNLRVPRVSLEDHLANMLGPLSITGLVDFDFGLDLTTGPGRALLRSVQFLATELDRPAGLVDIPLARDQLESYVLSTLLYAGRHPYSDALAGTDDRLRLGRVAPIVQYIEANADRELTPEILARVGCVSVRTLHATFHDKLGESPMAYVRKVRLHRARADLLRSAPQQVSVTEIAMRWGFVHLSRFAQQYRDQFKELPSATLHR